MITIILITVIIFIIFKNDIEHPFDLTAGIIVGLLMSLFIGSYLPQKEIINKKEICTINNDTMEYLKTIQLDNDTTQVRQHMEIVENGLYTSFYPMSKVIIDENDTSAFITHDYIFEEKWYWLIGLNNCSDDYVEILLPKSQTIEDTYIKADSFDNRLEFFRENENGESEKYFIGLSNNVTYTGENITDN